MMSNPIHRQEGHVFHWVTTIFYMVITKNFAYIAYTHHGIHGINNKSLRAV